VLEFIKRWWSYLVGAFITIGALMAANRATQAKERAQGAHDAAEVEKVAGHLGRANELHDEAKKWDDVAKVEEQRTKELMDQQAIRSGNETYKQTADRWRMSKRVRNSTNT
jgi:hypothetical protein